MDREKIIAYLNNDYAEFDTSEVEKWINENRAEYNKLKYIWEKAGVNTEEEPDMKEAWMQVNPEIRNQEGDGKKKIKILFTRFQRIAAILVLAASIASVLYFQFSKTNRVETAWIEAENNSDRVEIVYLADGTEVWLNTASAIRYPKAFNGKTREIYLEGEAFFEVEHNKKKPFVVYTKTSITKDLGTSFNIKTEVSGNVQVVVVTGSVALSGRENKNKKVVLKKGEMGLFSAHDQSVEKQYNENLNFLAWKTGILAFNKMPLTDVCEILTDHYKTKVKISDEALKEINLTATYNNKTFEEVLEIMQLTLNIHYHNSDSCVVLSSEK